MAAGTNEGSSPTRVLMVDDDLKLCRLICDYLQPLGYEVCAVHDGHAGIELASRREFSAVILDVMLPGIEGLEVLRRIRAHSDVPILMLTGRGEEADRIVGLELGADDYLPKTFSTRELLARLRAVIRRSIIRAERRADQEPQLVVLGDLSINEASHSAELAGVPLSLTAVEFELLRSLTRAAGRVKSREQLLLEAADRDFDVFDRSIDVHISSLRRKLGDDPKSPRFIVTIRSAGYMMRKPAAEEVS
jgi:DNA-binding response OmpR family regulator